MDKAAQELADTEDRLASDLQVLSDVFVGPLRAWAPQVSAELPRLEPTLERLFGPLDEVCASCGALAAGLGGAGATARSACPPRSAPARWRWSGCAPRRAPGP